MSELRRHIMMQQGGAAEHAIYTTTTSNGIELPQMLVNGDIPPVERYYIKWSLDEAIDQVSNYHLSTLIGFCSGYASAERVRAIRVSPHKDANYDWDIVFHYNYNTTYWGYETRVGPTYFIPSGIHECDVVFPNLNNGRVTTLYVNNDGFNYGQRMVNGGNIAPFYVGHVIVRAKVTIYAAKRWIGDELVFDLIPHMQDGHVGLLNLIDGEFYYKEGWNFV